MVRRGTRFCSRLGFTSCTDISSNARVALLRSAAVLVRVPRARSRHRGRSAVRRRLPRLIAHGAAPHWADVARALLHDPSGKAAQQAIQSCILRITRLTRPKLRASIEAQLGTEAMKKFVSTYDRAIQEGEARGKVKGRRRKDEVTLFKSVGSAIEDFAAAILVWKGLR